MDEGSTGTSSSTTSTKGSEKKGGLRNFRKEQVSLLKYFRTDGKKSDEDKDSKSSPNSTSGTDGTSSSASLKQGDGMKSSLKESDGQQSPIFKNRIIVQRTLNDSTHKTKIISGQRQTTVKILIQKPSSTVSLRTLSKPLFVGAPSPEMKEEENDNEADNNESSSESPLGGMSMKNLISKTSPTKRTLNSSDLDDSQDSPLYRVKVVKRARLVASSDEEGTPDTKKQHINGHGSCSLESSKKPDDDTMEKFLHMWGMVYPFVEKMELLDVYKSTDWDAKITMMQLSKTNRDRRDKEKIKRADEESQMKKLAAEKKEELKKQKSTEKEMESMARNAMKLKLKAKKDSWKAKAAMKQSDQDIEEEEEDYQLTRAKVYESDEDSEGEETPVLTGDRQLVLQFFNESTVGELTAIGGCSKKKAEMVMQLRPFADWPDIVHKFQTEKHVNTDLLNQAKTVLHVRSSVQNLMKKCEDIARDMQSIVSRIVNGEEDAGISKQPESLNSSMQLKGYQLIGLNWLVLMHEQGLNGVLADEMGLGKTIQAIAFLAYIKEVEDPERQSLIVVPSSTLDNWARELETWCPSLEVLHFHGSQGDRRNLRSAIMNGTLEEEPDVILTTYNMVTTSTEDRALFKKLRFHTIILDEAHMLKNMASQRYENLMKIKALRRILLTGTPLQNNLVELMSILIFVMPQLFDSKKEELKKVFAMFPKSDSSKGRFERERIEQAKRIMKPFFLRRLKCDVLKDLPCKEDEVKYAPMSKRQKKIYGDTVAVLSKKAQQQKIEFEKMNMKKLSEVEELKVTSGSVKSKEKDIDVSSNMVMVLRKIANHPLLVRRFYTDAKLKEMAKILKKTSHRDSVLEYIVEDFSVMSDFEIHTTCCQFNHIRKYRLDDELILGSGKMEQLDILLQKLKEEVAEELAAPAATLKSFE
ncbi:SMARCAD1 [Chionoecetes opilio]|uniref:SWI/SNF-related matrix-associated actin-dependent regulator of chromatin subfamily A containing DEAD/H box 1 homolog n=1 Tax=Chionoecetes opilio TaxID=41210 RepID=A0A8J4Y123_CHIOP|nr:SMARCAD1 [Chionoecetes opilio]